MSEYFFTEEQTEALRVSADTLRILGGVTLYEFENRPEPDDDHNLPFSPTNPDYGHLARFIETEEGKNMLVQASGSFSGPERPVKFCSSNGVEIVPTEYAELTVCYKGLVEITDASTFLQGHEYSFWEINDDSQYNGGVVIASETQDCIQGAEIIGSAQEVMELLDEGDAHEQAELTDISEDEQSLLWSIEFFSVGDVRILNAREAELLGHLIARTELFGVKELPARP